MDLIDAQDSIPLRHSSIANMLTGMHFCPWQSPEHAGYSGGTAILETVRFFTSFFRNHVHGHVFLPVARPGSWWTQWQCHKPQKCKFCAYAPSKRSARASFSARLDAPEHGGRSGSATNPKNVDFAHTLRRKGEHGHHFRPVSMLRSTADAVAVPQIPKI